MAYTLPVLDVDGATGKAAAYFVDPGTLSDDGPMFAPLSHIPRVLFHSDFTYFELAYDQTFSVSTASHTISLANYPSFPTKYTITVTSGLPSDVFFAVCFWNGFELRQGTVISTNPSNGKNVRFLSPSRSGTSIVLIESVQKVFAGWTASVPVTLAPVTGSLRVVGFRLATAQQSTTPADIDPANGVVQFGFGKIDLMGRSYMRATPAGVGSFKLTLTSTIDATTSGIKFWNNDGTTLTVGTYGGSYTGPTQMTVR